MSTQHPFLHFSISKAGKSLKVVHHVCEIFEETSGVSTTEYHPYPGTKLEKVLQALEEKRSWSLKQRSSSLKQITTTQHLHSSSKYNFLKNYHTKTWSRKKKSLLTTFCIDVIVCACYKLH